MGDPFREALRFFPSHGDGYVLSRLLWAGLVWGRVSKRGWVAVVLKGCRYSSWGSTFTSTVAATGEPKGSWEIGVPLEVTSESSRS